MAFGLLRMSGDKVLCVVCSVGAVSKAQCLEAIFVAGVPYEYVGSVGRGGGGDGQITQRRHRLALIKIAGHPIDEQFGRGERCGAVR